VARLIDPADLVGAAEIATRLGLSHVQNVHAWRRRYEDFPKPVVELTMGLIWRWSEVEAWAQRTGRLGSSEGRLPPP
jgi:predicted DNA-binding transcriptional regulator AlpA